MKTNKRFTERLELLNIYLNAGEFHHLLVAFVSDVTNATEDQVDPFIRWN